MKHTLIFTTLLLIFITSFSQNFDEYRYNFHLEKYRTNLTQGCAVIAVGSAVLASSRIKTNEQERPVFYGIGGGLIAVGATLNFVALHHLNKADKEFRKVRTVPVIDEKGMGLSIRF